MGDHLRSLASTAGFTVLGNGLEGQLQLGDSVTLDLTQQEEKLFAVELASVYSGLKAELAAASKSAELQVPQDDVAVYEVTMMTLSALAKKHGQDSELVAAATEAVARLLKWAVEGVDAAFGGDVVFQVGVSWGRGLYDVVRASGRLAEPCTSPPWLSVSTRFHPLCNGGCHVKLTWMLCKKGGGGVAGTG